MSKRFGPKAPRLEVTWEDSLSVGGGWHPIARLRKERAALCHSIGYPIRDSKRRLVLVGSVHGSNASEVVVIPKSAIRKQRRLRWSGLS